MCSDTTDQPAMPCFKDQMNRRNSPKGTDTVERRHFYTSIDFFSFLFSFFFLTAQDDEIKKDCEMSCG